MATIQTTVLAANHPSVRQFGARPGGEALDAGRLVVQTSHHSAHNHSTVGVSASAGRRDLNSPPLCSRATLTSGTNGPGVSW
jgi:hypothetical protein